MTPSAFTSAKSRTLLKSLFATLGVPRDRLAVVGDDPETDVEGARRAGLLAIQVRTGKGQVAGPQEADLTIDSIRDLPPLLLGAEA